MYRYYISCVFQSTRGPAYYTCEYNSRTPLRSAADVKALADQIGREQNLPHLVILAFSLFPKNDRPHHNPSPSPRRTTP
jgi:hypothetical protein